MRAAFQIGQLRMTVKHPVSGVDFVAPCLISDISDDLGPSVIVEPMQFFRVANYTGTAKVQRPVMGVPV